METQVENLQWKRMMHRQRSYHSFTNSNIYDYSPWLRHIKNSRTHWARRVLWLLVVVLGCGQSVNMVLANYAKFKAYPSYLKEEPDENITTMFPKITICLNSMHSLNKIEKFYPKMVKVHYLDKRHIVDAKLLSSFYGQQNGTLPRGANLTYLKSINVEKFLQETSSDVNIFGCRFGKFDCKGEWKTVKTLYGYCKEAVPGHFRDHNNHTITAQKTYNLTDWVPGGWAHYLEGYTIYYSHPDDQAFSPTNGILVADITRGVPIVSMYEKRTNLIGGHYSRCFDDYNKDTLQYFNSYTKEQCRQNCMLKAVMTECGCWPAFLPNRAHARVCDFIEHATCVAPLLANFEYMKHCRCPPKCMENETLCDSIQYGKYQGSPQVKRDSMLTSIMMYIKPEQRVYRTEQVEYDKTQFFSDVGGAAGLLLGISLTSLFGMLDSMLWLSVQFCVRNKNKIKQKFMPRSNLNDQCVSCDLFNKEYPDGRRQSVILEILSSIRTSLNYRKSSSEYRRSDYSDGTFEGPHCESNISILSPPNCSV